MKSYNHKIIETKWQKEWKRSKLYRTEEKGKKCYVLDMFPYPSGDGLHVGHPKGYIATDIYSRMKRMQGYSILHPMGFDAFGLPAENYAIKNKVNPRVAVATNVKRFKNQLEHLGFNYDWSREVNTTDPKYYRWTQWIFLQLLKKGLAYESSEPINWCPSCKTGLANEDLEDGKCERCGSMIERRPMRQWVLRITDYADRLLSGLDTLDWPNHIKESQRNWIGRSEGSLIPFKLQASRYKLDMTLEVFTTRPDTLFGVTYVCLAPENKLVTTLLSKATNRAGLESYIARTAAKSEIDRTDATKEKTGVRIEGIEAINPVNGEKVPVFIADYVLAQYGTGAVMAVPAHDDRDFAFAKRYDLAVKEVVAPLIEVTEGEFAFKPKVTTKDRRCVLAIVKHWKNDEYLVLESPKHGWKTFVIGGIEKGEDPVEAAKREIAEETGYTDIKSIRKLGGTIFAKHFAPHKGENRFAEISGYLVELKSGSHKKVEHHEAAHQTAHWIPAAEIPTTLHPKITDWAFWQRMVNHSAAFTDLGILYNSGNLDGKASNDAMVPITELAGGKRTVTYRLKDWVFSRQRYWGEPIPVIHCEACGVVPVPEDQLPVELPDVKSYEPTGTGESPLAAIGKWVNVKCPKCKAPAKRETNTMPQWAGSSWYYLRYMDPANNKELVSSKSEAYWSPVDVYVGGAEHATRHLIYARFWHKFLKDIGVVSTDEPFAKLYNVGLIMGEDGRKMSKRFGNVVDPDTIVNQVGADTLRLYEAFMGPFGDSISWSTASVAGARRFVERVWRLSERVVPDAKIKLPAEAEKVLHRTIKKVGDDISDFKFNTAVSALMVLVNEFEKLPLVPKSAFLTLVALVAPFAPYVAEDLWETYGSGKSVHAAPWPIFDAALAAAQSGILVVQVNGKVRAQFEPSVPGNDDLVKKEALGLPAVQKWIAGKEIRKVILVKGRLVSIVV